MVEKLLHCPFCGCDVESEGNHLEPICPDGGMEIYIIACPGCGAGVAPGLTQKEAIANWNKRSQIDEAVQLTKGLIQKIVDIDPDYSCSMSDCECPVCRAMVYCRKLDKE